MSGAMQAELVVQQKKEEWLQQELNVNHARWAPEQRRTGGVLLRQKSFQWLIDLDNMLKFVLCG